MRVPALAIAAFVRERSGCASSHEILEHFWFGRGNGQTTLRRRRPQLHRLGIEFIENGSGSFYVTRELLVRSTRAIP